MGFLFGLLIVGISLGVFIGLFVPLPSRAESWPRGRLSAAGIAVTIVVALAGGALGLMGPPVVLGAMGIGTGSYEDVLFIWPLTVGSFPVAFGLLSIRWFRGAPA